MLKSDYKGTTIEIILPEECGHEGYIVDCTYRFDKSAGKYLLSMWLRHKHIRNGFSLAPQEVDTQHITSTKMTIARDIRRIVEYACLNGFFEEYIQRYEYEQRCFERGNELFERERSMGHNDEQERL